MSYANKIEVLEGIILKLRKKVRKLQDERAEINVKLEVYPGTDFRDSCERLNNREETVDWSIKELEAEIELHEKALNKEKNGNANIDPFLN